MSQVPGDSGRSGHLVVTSNWWVLVAVAVPLTLITLYIWWFCVEKQAYGRYPKWFRMILTGAQKGWVQIMGLDGSARGRGPRSVIDDTEI